MIASAQPLLSSLNDSPPLHTHLKHLSLFPLPQDYLLLNQYVRQNIVSWHHTEQYRGTTRDKAVSLPVNTLHLRLQLLLTVLPSAEYLDDSAINSCISRGQDVSWRSVVDRLEERCGLNCLQLSITKTKELVVDFRKQGTYLNPVSINGKEVDIVDNYKCLGIHIDNKLDCTEDIDAVFKKGQSCLYILRRLRSLNICRNMLNGVQRYLLLSAVTFRCWYIMFLDWWGIS